MNEIEWKAAFAAKLRIFAERAGLNQRMLSNKTGLAISSISRYFNGERVPDATRLIKLAEAVGCTVEDLINHKLD